MNDCKFCKKIAIKTTNVIVIYYSIDDEPRSFNFFACSKCYERIEQWATTMKVLLDVLTDTTSVLICSAWYLRGVSEESLQCSLRNIATHEDTKYFKI